MIGIDEVGRGAWAGPLVVGLVRFQGVPTYVRELNDSKLLKKHTRESLAERIKHDCEWAVGVVAPTEIDALGLTAATRLAILRGLKKFTDVDDILIDGNVNYLKTTMHEDKVTLLVKADQKIPEVMAASIIAKVHRDHIMQKLAKKYPDYGFDKNVGYGAKQHQSALYKNGHSEAHRISYRPIKRSI